MVQYAIAKKEMSAMDISTQIKQLRKKNNLTQESFAKKIYVSRQAVSKWESGRGIPDIENIISISETFNVSLDKLIMGNERIKDRIITDHATKKWHILVIIYLISIVGYIAYFVFRYQIFMVGFLISTLFMLGIELRIYFRHMVKKKILK